MICEITEERSAELIKQGTGYLGVGGRWDGTTGDMIYGMENGDYFIPASLRYSNEAIDMLNVLTEEIEFFSSVFQLKI